jgi:hypothetical protein
MSFHFSIIKHGEYFCYLTTINLIIQLNSSHFETWRLQQLLTHKNLTITILRNLTMTIHLSNNETTKFRGDFACGSSWQPYIFHFYSWNTQYCDNSMFPPASPNWRFQSSMHILKRACALHVVSYHGAAIVVMAIYCSQETQMPWICLLLQSFH